MKKMLSVLFVICISASVASATFLTSLDGFESDSNGAAPAGTGWSSTGVTVTNSGAHAGTKAAYFAADAMATNTISESSPTKAWTDFQIKPALGVEPASPPTNSSSALFFFDADGYINVWNETEWTVCSNDVWNSSVSAVTGGDYVWISIYQNYANNELALFLEDQLIIQDVPFPKTSLTDYSSFVVQNVDSNAYLDNVWIKTTPEGTHALNLNNRAGIDVVEVDTYGYAGRTLYVGGSSVPNYSTVVAAVADARDNDEINIDVAYSTVNENVTVSPDSELSELVFVGNCFTVNTFTVNSGVSVEFNSCIAAATITASDDILLANGAYMSATTLLNLQGTATITGTAGTDITVADLDMVAGTTIDVTTGDFDATGVITLSGTFIVNGENWDGWNGADIIAQSLPFTDGFERYVVDSAVTSGGLYALNGWAASADGVIVQSAEKNAGSRALYLPDGTAASNKIAAATGSIWTEYYIRPALGAEPASSDTTGKSFMSYVATNGHMFVYDGSTWDECDKILDVNGEFNGPSPASLSSNSFKRIVIFQDFSTSKFALFVDNSGELELVAQNVSFPGTQTSMNRFVIDSNDNKAYIDDISISTTSPTGFANLDGDDMDDGAEIALNGTTRAYPAQGTIFKFI